MELKSKIAIWKKSGRRQNTGKIKFFRDGRNFENHGFNANPGKHGPKLEYQTVPKVFIRMFTLCLRQLLLRRGLSRAAGATECRSNRRETHRTSPAAVNLAIRGIDQCCWCGNSRLEQYRDAPGEPHTTSGVSGVLAHRKPECTKRLAWGHFRNTYLPTVEISRRRMD